MELKDNAAGKAEKCPKCGATLRLRMCTVGFSGRDSGTTTSELVHQIDGPSCRRAQAAQAAKRTTQAEEGGETGSKPCE